MLNNTGLSKRLFLTGATGFSGSYVLKGFVDAGWNVDIFLRSTPLKRLLIGYEDAVTFHAYDGSMDSVSKALLLAKPDLVIHMASMVLGTHDKNTIGELIASNILLGTQLLEGMVEHGIDKFINTGSYWEHYQGEEYNPVGLYAATKYAFQNILHYYVEAKGFHAITLKLFDAYGLNDPRPKLINLLLNAVATGQKLDLSPGEQKVDLIHVDDVVSAYLTAANRLMSSVNVSNEVYGVGTGCLYSIKEIVEIIESITDDKLNIVWGGRPYREREVMMPCQHLKELPNWNAKVSLKQGIRKILDELQ